VNFFFLGGGGVGMGNCALAANYLGVWVKGGKGWE